MAMMIHPAAPSPWVSILDTETSARMSGECGYRRLTAYVRLEQALLPVDVVVHATRANEVTGEQEGPCRMFSEARLHNGTYRYECVVPVSGDDEDCAWVVTVTRLAKDETDVMNAVPRHRSRAVLASSHQEVI